MHLDAPQKRTGARMLAFVQSPRRGAVPAAHGVELLLLRGVSRPHAELETATRRPSTPQEALEMAFSRGEGVDGRKTFGAAPDDDVVNTPRTARRESRRPPTRGHTPPLPTAAIFGQQSVASTLLAAPGRLLAKDGRGESADHAVGERFQLRVGDVVPTRSEAAGALDAVPAVAAQVAQLREGAKAAAPAASSRRPSGCGETRRYWRRAGT